MVKCYKSQNKYPKMYSCLSVNNCHYVTNLQADKIVYNVNNRDMLGHTKVGEFKDLIYLENDC